jgi:16S rRNA (uracil1498-N3)-methyltransferase
MQFTYFKDAGLNHINIDGDLHKYLFKIRRHNADNNIQFRNLIDHNIYEYKITNITKKNTNLDLVNSYEKIISPSKYLHIAWCIIDTKNIEKNIALLNEIGVSKITFISCDFTQNKYKINFDKLTILLQNSSSQCGRSDTMELDINDSLDDFLLKYPNTYMFNFSKNNISLEKVNIETILVGCEGGFSQNELNKFKEEKIVGCNSNTILQSQTAVIGLASSILL